MGDKNAYNIFVENTEGKRPHGRLRRIRKDNIRMDLSDTGWEDVDRIHLAQDRDQRGEALVNTVENLRVI
jgi:hypothetical protein